MRRHLPILVLLALLAGCEHPRPLSPHQAATIADMHLDKAGLYWGPTHEVCLLEGEDDRGRRWFKVDYGPDPETGDPRVVLVNHLSKWARFPHPDEAIIPAGDQAVESTQGDIQQ